MGLLADLAGKLLRAEAPIDTVSRLGEFLDSRAAFMAQKCVVEFCRVRAGVYWQKLFSEQEFQRELALSRWRSYPPAYAMVAEMVEGALRPAAGVRRVELPAALAGMAERTFSAYPVPEREGEGFWGDAATLVREALEKARAEAARPVREIPKPLARKIFDALPIHKTIVSKDYDYIFNNLRMNLLRAHEDFENAVRPEMLLDELLRPR